MRRGRVPAREDLALRMSGAGQAVVRGNYVRAALRRARLRGVDAGRPLLLPLADQVAQLLEEDGEEPDERRARTREVYRLVPRLLGPRSLRRFSLPLRTLFDLQAGCVDVQREDPIDYVEWLRTFGQRPAVRPLPVLRELTRLRRVARIVRRLKGGRPDLAGPAAKLAQLLGGWVERDEARFRAQHAPHVVRALDAAGLADQGPPGEVERVAEALLSRLVARGGLDLGDLRDAVSRSALVIPIGEAMPGGDPLLAADSRLAVVLDGVYYRGEVYLRALHRLQAVAFGTHWGRVLSVYVLFPFGGAFLALEAIEHLLAWGGWELPLVSWWGVVGLGLALVAVTRLEVLRRLVTAPLRGLSRVAGRWLHTPRGAHRSWPRLRRLAHRVARAWRGLFDRVTVAVYHVDEWLRYRGGDQRGARQVEAVSALGWFVFGYALRFAFRLVIEPTVNPIKHFPTVTVAGKLSMTSVFPLMTYGFQQVMPVGLAASLALPICLVVIPGFSGFLVWELRANWDLYGEADPVDPSGLDPALEPSHLEQQ
ncbi:MAG: hypothetical protein ACFCGT_18875 [Sandaracinaceae bacterium]